MGSITGHILAMLVFIISLFAKSYYMVFFSLASFIIGISGRSSITTFSVYSHVSDNTSVNTRTFRIGMLSGCGYMGLCIGSLLVALLSPYIAVYYILAIVIFFLILCLLTVSFFLVPYVGENDTRIEMKQYDALNENKDDFEKKLNVLTKGESSNEQFYYAWWNFKKRVKEKPDQDTKISENCKRTATSVMTLFKKRENYQRLYLNFLIIFVFLHQASKAYHIDALLMITKSEPFFFTTAQFGYLLCITYIIFGLGALVLTPLFTKVLMLNDVVLLSFGCMANFVRFLCLTLSKEVWMIYASECIIGGSLYCKCNGNCGKPDGFSYFCNHIHSDAQKRHFDYTVFYIRNL
ncbi:hypothetical protein A3Q56_00924 [Intoshia linei]|uniref:Major facilitator superfamily (MFS) profile domain-containing protein n=1 Tax=Intoshia linei TaxID=1819745 RepID=A0A177BCS6_9BILA|nr:hypothetical protein A3Q56_00924 [Intoshia linei]